MYTKSIWVPIVIGLSVMSGCNNSENSQPTSATVSEVKPLVQQKNVYASTSIGNGNILFGGENGLSIINTSDSENSQKLTKSFSLPTFESSNEVFKRTDGVAYYKSDEGIPNYFTHRRGIVKNNANYLRISLRNPAAPVTVFFNVKFADNIGHAFSVTNSWGDKENDFVGVPAFTVATF